MIYIFRHLTLESNFTLNNELLKKMIDKTYHALNDYMIKYDFIKEICPFKINFFKNKIDPDFKPDFLLFTSKNAFFSLVYEFGNSTQTLNHIFKIPCIAIGSNTQSKLLQITNNVFTHSAINTLEELINRFQEILKRKKILYFRAEKIIGNIEFLKKISEVKEVINYKSIYNEIDLNIKFESNSIFIFGSPSLYYFFLQNFEWSERYIAISLGATTFKSFQNGIQKYNAKGSYEKALKLALNLKLNSFN